MQKLNNIVKLKEVIDGKKVAIVGPSPHITNCGLGKIIDEYDVVCRPNYYLPSGLREDFGSFTNVVFHNGLDVIIKNIFKQIDDDANYKEHLKLLVSLGIYPIFNSAYVDQTIDVDLITKNIDKLNKQGLEHYEISRGIYQDIVKVFGVRPNCGLLAIYTLLLYCIEELFITGFSFFEQGKQAKDAYFSGYFSPRGRGSHNQPKQKRFFKSKIMKNFGSVIRVDSFVNDLLDLKHDKVVKLK